MSKDIARSPEMLQKEANIKDLQAQLKKRKTTLKSLKTRLNTTQTKIDVIQREVHNQLFSKMSELDDLRLEIIELAKTFEQSKNISDEDRSALASIAEELTGEDLFGNNFLEYKAQREAMEKGEFEFEEDFRAKMEDAFAQFKVKPEEEEQRSIRNVFIKLSRKFHPDLAQSDKEAQEYHLMMQRINEAYQNNDVQTLLDFEQMYLIEDLDLSSKAITIDILDEEIKRLKRDLDFIEGQISRTSGEIKNLRSSEMGQMLTSMSRAEREGEGISQMVDGINESIEQLSRFKDGLKDSIELDQLSPSLLKLLNPFVGTPLEKLGLSPDMTQEEMMQRLMQAAMSGEIDLNEVMKMIGGNNGSPTPNEMMAQMFGGGAGLLDGEDEDDSFLNFFDFDEEDDSFLNFFDFDDDDEEFEPIENPQFSIGSHVKVAKAMKNPYDKKLKMKNWVGEVINAYYDEDGNERYEIALDSESMKQYSKEVLQDILMDEEDFRFLIFKPQQLVLSLPRCSNKENIATYRQLKHQNAWTYLKNKQAKRLTNILLQYPEKSDEENWMIYLEEHLSFPFEVETLGDLGPKTPLKVTGFAFIDDEYAVIMEVKQGQNKSTYPLLDMEVKKKNHPNYQIVEDYIEWADSNLFV